ncbi:bestrophin family protein [Elizabethkingia anophelis]|uniref:bestrophin family ion channel n=1 Tax=Elizabethkingia anophelis TaxID=1117645 RepID=UPI0021A2B4EF
MHTGKRYTPFEFAKWTKRDTLLMLLIATVPTILYVIGWKFIGLPWQPVAILGTAVAFIVGFKNNASYNRIWEARQIYGAIINDSRSFAYSVRDTLGGKRIFCSKKNFLSTFCLAYSLKISVKGTALLGKYEPKK